MLENCCEKTLEHLSALCGNWIIVIWSPVSCVSQLVNKSNGRNYF